MATLPILTFPAKSLKQPSAPVHKVTNEIRQLVKNMFETMAAGCGIGLAAPQVGQNIAVFVMDVGKKNPKDEKNIILTPFCLINPRILEKSGDTTYAEGCLSCPDLTVEVDRAQRVVVEALDVDGKLQQYVFEDLEAVCVQHEMDHLAGVLLTDHISRLKRELYKKKLKHHSP